MKVILMPDHVKMIGFDNPANRLLIRSAFFTGHGLNYIAILIEGKSMRRADAKDIIKFAADLGMDDSDVVVTYEEHLAAGRERVCNSLTSSVPDKAVPGSA